MRALAKALPSVMRKALAQVLGPIVGVGKIAWQSAGVVGGASWRFVLRPQPAWANARDRPAPPHASARVCPPYKICAPA